MLPIPAINWDKGHAGHDGRKDTVLSDVSDSFDAPNTGQAKIYRWASLLSRIRWIRQSHGYCWRCNIRLQDNWNSSQGVEQKTVVKIRRRRNTDALLEALANHGQAHLRNPRTRRAGCRCDVRLSCICPRISFPWWEIRPGFLGKSSASSWECGSSVRPINIVAISLSYGDAPGSKPLRRKRQGT